MNNIKYEQYLNTKHDIKRFLNKTTFKYESLLNANRNLKYET